MTPDAKIFCELLAVEDESWQDCVEACLGDRRFDILVPPAHYAAAKSAFVALKEKVGPISLLDTPGIRKANRRTDKIAPPPVICSATIRSGWNASARPSGILVWMPAAPAPRP